ncbi:hypothetical protein PMKS-000877 [Pichia membranifaciens]|uniref:Uncharacterized protein n=1 Tax=Pichia membranifaciens TaxID=4926 RepID=A0A1Q2YCZ5_9ASCO|nr:hypothetical protein PMKS-000877 [Pichia membranifaciens]
MLSSLPTTADGRSQPETDEIYERSVYPETSLAHNLSATPISPYVPIKSLVESPFKPSHAHAHSTPLLGSSSSYFRNTNGIGIQTPSKHDPMNAESLLKMKIKAHQRQFQDNMNTMQAGFNLADKQVSEETYLNSAFKPRRSTADVSMTHLKDIGSRKSVDGITSNGNISQNDANGINLPLEPLRMSSYNEGTSKYISESKGGNVSVLQNLDDPYVAEALGRIVNKELEMRKLLYGTLTFLIYRFLRSIIRLFVYTNPIFARSLRVFSKLTKEYSSSIQNERLSFFLKWLSQLFTFESFLKVGSYIEYIMSFILGTMILSTLYRLLKPQDKCLDLPLSRAQRKILGLRMDSNEKSIEGKESGEDDDNENDDDEEEAILKKLLSSSPQKIEQPTRVVMPGDQGIDDVMGSLNSLAIGNGVHNAANVTWSSGMIPKANSPGPGNMETIRSQLSQRNGSAIADQNYIDGRNSRDFLSFNGKYMFAVNNELRQQGGFGASNSSFY